MTALLVPLALTVVASSQPAAVDAFVSSPERRSVVSAAQLSAAGRRAFERAQISSIEPRLGLPSFVWVEPSPVPARTLRAMGVTPVQAARRALAAHVELYRADVRRWLEAPAVRVHDRGGAVVVSFAQQVGGVRVFRDELKVVLTRDLELVALAGYLTPQVRPLAAFRLSVASAALVAMGELAARPVDATEVAPVDVRGGWSRFTWAESRSLVRARAVYFPLPEGLEPAVQVELETADGLWAVVVSACDGATLFRQSLTANDQYTYRVWAGPDQLPFDGPQGNDWSPHRTGAPNGMPLTMVPSQLVTLASGPITTGDLWLPAMATQARGNNAVAYGDLRRPNGFGTGDLTAAATGLAAFDTPFDFDAPPDASDAQRRAGLTQAFYDVNFFHDWFYDSGFDEGAGNGQTDNYGRGGADGDAMLIEGQDYSARNNASMSTPSDGASPRLQLHLFDGQPVEEVSFGGRVYPGGVATFGPQRFSVTAPAELVDDGVTPLSDACSPLVGALAGRVAVIDRGICTFVDKVRAAETAGAVGVIIIDNQSAADPNELMGSGASTIPAMSVTRAVGATLKSQLAAGAVSLTLTRGGTFDRDSALDNTIVAHEWGHFISNRLIGDGTGLSNQQGRALGEGWADFHALLMMVRESDVSLATNTSWEGAYAVGAFAESGGSANSSYFGVRRAPYSTSFGINALTFKHITNGVALPTGMTIQGRVDGQNNAEVHASGEVWALALWEVYAGLLQDPRYSFQQAQARMKRLLVAAYMATPLMPTFIEARDALLAVAAAEDRQDFVAFATAFARRGMGVGAVAPDRDSPTNAGVVESFALGAAAVISDVAVDDVGGGCDADGVLDTDEVGGATVTVRNVGVDVLQAPTLTLASADGAVQFPSSHALSLGPIAAFSSAKARVAVALGGPRGLTSISLQVTLSDPSLAAPVARVVTVRVNTDVAPGATAIDDVEASRSEWTAAHSSGTRAGSDWRIVQTSPTEHHWFGPDPSSLAETWLRSPALQVGPMPLTITFRHRYDFERDASTNYDGAVVELSTDGGGSWVDVGTLGQPGYTGTLDRGSNPLSGRRAYTGKSAGYPAFLTETISLGTQYDGRTVWLRFRIGADEATAAKGWELDDIGFTGLSVPPFAAVTADTNECTGNRAPTLAAPETQRVTSGDAVTLTAQVSDLDGDPVTVRFIQREGVAVALDGSGFGFIAPDVELQEQLVFEVVASDGALSSVPQEQVVVVSRRNTAPVASLPSVIEVESGQLVTLVGSGIDAEMDSLTFEWTQSSGAAVEFAGLGTDTVTFTAPEVVEPTLLTFQLVVRDELSESTPARVDVVVKRASGARGGCGCGAAEVLPFWAWLAWALAARGRRGGKNEPRSRPG